MSREELEAEIAREQWRVDEMKRRRMRKRPDGTEYKAHDGYDQEIDDVEDWLSMKRAELSRRFPGAVKEIRIFLRPAVKLADVNPEGTRAGAHPAMPGSLPEIRVVRIGQTVRSIDGRARVFDEYRLLLDGKSVAGDVRGTRREVMFQAHRCAELNAMGQLPLYLDTSAPRWLVWDSIRHMQQENRRHRRKSRRVRKRCKMLARALGVAFVDRLFGTDAIYPKLLTRSPLG